MLVVAGAAVWLGLRRGERRADMVDIHPVFVAFGIEVIISLGRFGGLQEHNLQ